MCVCVLFCLSERMMLGTATRYIAKYNVSLASTVLYDHYPRVWTDICERESVREGGEREIECV